MDDEIVEVIEAWINPGPYPEYHHRMQDSLREQWPTLANALDRMTLNL